jgi:PIN domain nuclease of toxin-antitoxin system
MARTKQRLAYLDTHIVVWLYDNLVEKLTAPAKKTINNSDLFISPLVKLELQYLYEIKKIRDKPEPIVASLQKSIALKISNADYGNIVGVALSFDWTRDPFDRLLVAEAHLKNAYFITADKNIRINYQLAV